MIFGTDTARYQPDGTYDPGAFEIVNIEDPQFEQKTARNLREGRPTGFYPWIYPGTDVAAFTRWAIGKARAAGANFGAWADYEQDGVTLNLLDQFFAACDELGEPAGYYGNDWRFGNHAAYLARPFWLAGYPDPNDGIWRDGYAPRASRPVQIWQWSSGGGLDRNVIIDEVWFANWVHGTPPPSSTPTTTTGDPNMELIIGPNETFAACQGAYVGGPYTGERVNDIPVDAAPILHFNPKAIITRLNQAGYDAAKARCQAANGAGGTIDVDALAKALAPKLQLTVDAHAMVAPKA